MNRRPLHLVLSGLLLTGVAAACGDDEGAEVGTSATEATESTGTTETTGTTAPTATTATTSAPTTPTTTPGRPQAPAEVAATVADAWAAGDHDVVEANAERDAAELLAALEAPDGPWEPAGCEGAAGSSYCRFDAPGATLTLRVGNEAGTVTEATLTATREAVALWPLTTAEEAQGTQAEVDAGSSPWHLEPDAVVLAFAEAELGFASPSIDTGASDGELVRVTSADGAAAGVAVGQPARTGPGGIWAVVAVQSVPR